MSDTPCNICDGLWPPADHFIEELPLTRISLFDDQFFPGWMVMTLKHHATELFELSPDMRRTLMEEVSRAAHALSLVFRARKVNYELLGNQVPHMHWHVIPRLPHDPAPLQPVWCVPHDPVRLSGQELAERTQLIRRSLQSFQ